MAFNEGMFNTLGMVAGADLSAKQFFAVVATADTTYPPAQATAQIATAAKACTGILQDNPVAGQAACVQASGITKAAISASQTITAGTTMLEVDTGGTLKVNASGIIVAEAMENLTSVAKVCIISVRLLPSNAAIA
jgi:hypothetical protein